MKAPTTKLKVQVVRTPRHPGPVIFQVGKVPYSARLIPLADQPSQKQLREVLRNPALMRWVYQGRLWLLATTPHAALELQKAVAGGVVLSDFQVP